MQNTILMGKSKYTVTLTDDQRLLPGGTIGLGRFSASTIRHAYILLHADKPDPEVTEIFRCHLPSMFNVRKAFVTQGLDAGTPESSQTGRRRRSSNHPDCLQQTAGGPISLDVAVAC